MKKTRILLIEDNRLLREGITTTINGQPDLRVVAASSGNNVMPQARRVKPDVVLMDLGLRNQNGLRVMASINRELPEIKVIGLGLIPSQVDIIELVEAGASGFVLKDSTVKDFLRTILHHPGT